MGVLEYVDNGEAGSERLRYALNKETTSSETIIQTNVAVLIFPSRVVKKKLRVLKHVAYSRMNYVRQKITF